MGNCVSGCVCEKLTIPLRTSPGHRIQDRQEFAHAGGQDTLRFLVTTSQALVERSQHRVEAGSGYGCHVKRTSHTHKEREHGSLVRFT
jgi:hypothetical protein